MPLGESGGAAELVVPAALEMALRREVVVQRSMNRGEFLQTTYLLLPDQCLVVPECRIEAWWTMGRSDARANLLRLAPLLHQVGGAELMLEAAEAVIDLGRWWP